MAARFLSNFALFVALASLIASATDPNQLDNFCVAPKNLSAAVLVNGQLCKDPMEVTVDNFVFRKSGSTGNVNVNPTTLPGLNTLGISMVQINAAPGEMLAPHIHPHATEVAALLQGSLYAGFVSYNQTDNSAKLFSEVLSPGDVFVFPQDLLHFTLNIGETNARVVSAFSSQNAERIFIAPALFETQPPISVDLLSKAFNLDPKIVMDLQSKH